MNMITFSQIPNLVRRYPTLIIDLREPEAYEEKHYTDAINIYHEEILDRVDELPKDRYLVLYCERGGSAMWAGRELGALGFQVIVVASGFQYFR